MLSSDLHLDSIQSSISTDMTNKECLPNIWIERSPGWFLFNKNCLTFKILLLFWILSKFSFFYYSFSVSSSYSSHYLSSSQIPLYFPVHPIFFLLLIMCLPVCLCEIICTWVQLSLEARRRCWLCLCWNYRHLWMPEMGDGCWTQALCKSRKHFLTLSLKTTCSIFFCWLVNYLNFVMLLFSQRPSQGFIQIRVF